MADRIDQGALAVDGSAAAGWGAALANAARIAGPPLLFGFRLWASVCLALFVAFKLELDNGYWAGTSAAIVCQPLLGASLRKAWYRIVGTLIGAVTIVVLTAWFPQGRIGFFVGLALWGGICAFAATLFRNFASYAAALAGYTAAIIAADVLGPTGGASSDVFMLAVTRASEIWIGILCAGLVLAGTDFGAAPRRLATMFAAVSAEVTAQFKSTLQGAGSGSFDKQQPARRELIRQVIALDPLIDQAIGESARLHYHSPVLQAAIDGLFAALAAWRGVVARLARSPTDVARADAEAVLRSIPGELRSALPPGETAPWMTDPISSQQRCDAAARTLIAMPAGTPSLRLAFDQTANVLAGFAAVFQALALLVADPARPMARPWSARLYIPDWLPAFVNGGRAFLVIGAVELFWVVTAWPNGGSAVVFVAIVILLLSPRAELAYGAAIAFTVGTTVAIPFAATMKFAVLPAIETFPAFCLALGAFLVPAGAALALSRQPTLLAIWSAMAFNFIPVLQPSNEMSYDTAQFYNAALAIFVGCAVAPLSFLVMPPLSPEFRAKRLLRLTLRGLRRLAINPLPMEPEDWQGRIHSRLAALPDAAEPLQRAQLLAAFSVGTEIIHLRRIMPELGLAQELESTLQSLARGNSVAATAQLAALDHRLASIVNFSAQGSLAMRARGRILVVSDALADHREYFEGESA
jgi:uncharacterized membrane protein YccC